MFTFYWIDGRRSVAKGKSINEAFTNLGYGHGALKALDFWVEGDDYSYIWNKDDHSWDKVDINTTHKCKWCGIDTTNIETDECDGCWELRRRIEYNIELAKKMINELEKS